MPTNRLFEALGKLTADEREMLRVQRYDGDYDDAEDADERATALAAAREFLDKYRLAANSRAQTLGITPTDSTGNPDRRWDLLQELERARGAVEDDALPEPPMTIEYQPPVLELPHRLTHGWVAVRFDDRLSFAAAIEQLKRSWPALRKMGLPARRPLGDRKLALVRFVCLEADVRDTWRDRLEAWNAAHPEWPYADARAMQSDFRRAEESLTGSRGGLRWFYDQDYCERWQEDFRADFSRLMATIQTGIIDDGRR